MIEEARRRNIYSDLMVEDFETALAAPGLSYDLIIAGDALIYHGDLLPVLSGAARRLDPAASVSSRWKKCWAKAGNRRRQTVFVIAKAYLRSCAEHSGFAVAEIAERALRSEFNAPVEGFAVALKKLG